jgi:hypothetical protein
LLSAKRVQKEARHGERDEGLLLLTF